VSTKLGTRDPIDLAESSMGNISPGRNESRAAMRPAPGGPGRIVDYLVTVPTVSRWFAVAAIGIFTSTMTLYSPAIGTFDMAS
jgi:hypothetical protein